MEERRRSPRYVTDGTEFAGLPFSLAVQVLDISVGGILAQSHQPAQVGARGALRLTLSGHAFTADVAVTRVSRVPAGGDARYRIAARFIALSPEVQQVIERFAN